MTRTITRSILFSGDAFSDCLPCPSRSYSSAIDRSVCICDEIQLRSEVNFTLHFNISTGLCDEIPTNLVPLLADGAWLESTGPTAFTRSAQYPCEEGYFCIDGVKQSCPGGYAGSYTRETRPLCSAICAAGYYCPAGSVSPYAVVCGSAALFCPTGSAYPQVAPAGFFTNQNSAATNRQAQSLCTPGYFCVDGLITPCPAGSFSDYIGASSCLPCLAGTIKSCYFVRK